MSSGVRFVAFSAFVAAAVLVIHADGQLLSQAADIELRLGRMLFDQGQYPEALDAYRNAVNADDSATVRQARAGVIQSALRVADFELARREADTLVKAAPRDPDAVSLYGDSLWAAGLFDAGRGATIAARWRCRPNWRADATAWPSRCSPAPSSTRR